MVCLPSIHNYTKERTYYLLTLTTTIMLLCASTLILADLSLKFRLILVLLIICIYRRNISFLMRCIWHISRGNKQNIQKNVWNLFEDNFHLVHNFEKLPDTPSILLANYGSDRFESIAAVLIPRRMIFVMKEKLNSILAFNRVVDCIETKKDKSFELLENQVCVSIRSGVYVFCYPCESPYIHQYNYGRMHSGIFRIAWKNKIPITLLHFDFLDTIGGAIYKQRFRIHVGESFRIHSEYGLQNAIYKTKKFFKEQTKLCMTMKT